MGGGLQRLRVVAHTCCVLQHAHRHERFQQFVFKRHVLGEGTTVSCMLLQFQWSPAPSADTLALPPARRDAVVPTAMGRVCVRAGEPNAQFLTQVSSQDGTSAHQGYVDGVAASAAAGG